MPGFDLAHRQIGPICGANWLAGAESLGKQQVAGKTGGSKRRVVAIENNEAHRRLVAQLPQDRFHIGECCKFDDQQHSGLRCGLEWNRTGPADDGGQRRNVPGG